MTEYILSNAEMQLADNITIDEGTPSLDLMENAGNAILKHIALELFFVTGFEYLIVVFELI